MSRRTERRLINSEPEVNLSNSVKISLYDTSHKVAPFISGKFADRSRRISRIANQNQFALTGDHNALPGFTRT